MMESYDTFMELMNLMIGILILAAAVLGLPGGYLVLYILLTALAGEYELSITMGIVTYMVSVLLTFGVSFLVGVMVSGKSKKIDMVEALKDAQ